MKKISVGLIRKIIICVVAVVLLVLSVINVWIMYEKIDKDRNYFNRPRYIIEDTVANEENQHLFIPFYKVQKFDCEKNSEYYDIKLSVDFLTFNGISQQMEKLGAELYNYETIGAYPQKIADEREIWDCTYEGYKSQTAYYFRGLDVPYCSNNGHFVRIYVFTYRENGKFIVRIVRSDTEDH